MRAHISTLLLAVTSLDAAAQGTITSRVAQAPNGVVHLQYDGRAGVCGNGRDMVGYRNSYFARNMQSYGTWHDAKCVPGPLRVTLSVAGGQVTRVQTQVGGTWPDAEGRVTDLGTVQPRDASAYFFSLVPLLETQGGKDRLLLPAVLAEDAPIIAPLLALARDDARETNTRRDAMHWLGQLGDASVVAPLVGFAKSDTNDDDTGKSGRKSLATAALAALSMIEGDVGIPALIDLARSGSTVVRRDAVFWLGQTDDPRARATLHAVIENREEQEQVRSHAI
ncbi:MAG: HEAT repeat domain-containing protein, partial [Gemmatimonadaceae bacterium]